MEQQVNIPALSRQKSSTDASVMSERSMVWTSLAPLGLAEGEASAEPIQVDRVPRKGWGHAGEIPVPQTDTGRRA